MTRLINITLTRWPFAAPALVVALCVVAGCLEI
jgi:hypothetical protein